MKVTPETQARAQGVLDYIHEHPEEHNQENYFCGTSKCIAGTAIALGYDCHTEKSWYGGLNVSLAADGEPYVSPFDIGKELLGLTEAEALSIFMEMDGEIALQRLKYVITGDQFGMDAAVQEWRDNEA